MELTPGSEPQAMSSGSASSGTRPIGERPVVTVDIGELVLHGFPAAQRHHIGDAVQTALGRLIARRGLPPHFDPASNHDRLDGGAFRLPPRGAPALIGRRIANAIYRSLGR